MSEKLSRPLQHGAIMTISDYSIAAFALLNSARVIAYAPQIRCLARDHSNAASVSLLTWSLFALANAATVAYALVVIDDPLMAAIFVLNLLGCPTIVVMIAKRRLYWSSSMIGGSNRDSSRPTLPRRLMLSYRRNKEERLLLHLRLTLPAHKFKRYEAYGSAIRRQISSPSVRSRMKWAWQPTSSGLRGDVRICAQSVSLRGAGRVRS